jgi:endonuclease/exonuclease/phosphatase family metal-dependent hydrolase
MSQRTSLRVLTFNLWGHHGDWPARRAALRSGLQELQPDLVALQEVVVSEGYDQVSDLLGSGYHVLHQAGRGADGVGASIASRWPITPKGERFLHVTPRVDRTSGWIGSVAAIQIDVPGAIGALLFVHHKPAWQWGFEHERELQAVDAARFIEDLAGDHRAHVVLAGDFDATPDAASMRFWRGRQSLQGMSVCYASVWESLHPNDAGHTFTPRNPLVRSGEMPLERGRRIDHIFVRCGDHGPTLEVEHCALAFSEPVDGVWASDHFGVVADLAPLA